MKKLIVIALTLTALTTNAMNANDKARVLEKLNSARSEMQSLRSLIPKVYRPIIDNNLKNADQKIVEVSAILATAETYDNYNQHVPNYPNQQYAACSDSTFFVKSKCNYYALENRYPHTRDFENFEIIAQGYNIVDAQNSLWQLIDAKKKATSTYYTDCTPIKVVDSYGRDIN